MSSQGEAALLPPDAVLLHIGPYKTGSTALQSALFARQGDLPEHGVSYPGSWRRLFGIGHALLRWAPRGHKLPDVERWDRFAAQVRADDHRRVCLSTEDFGRIQKTARSRKIVEDLGADRLHVVAVARAYHRLLPSHWQERVKSHQVADYEQFLREVLSDDPDAEARRSFRSSHDISWMLSMWLPHLPPERFTIIISDDTDRSLLTRTFEQMLGLPEQFLASPGPGATTSANASLSFEATEMLRRLNHVFEDRGWSDQAYTRYVQAGLVPALQAAGRSSLESPVPPLPAWAHALVLEQSQARVRAIVESGINVVGDPARLLPPDVVDAPPGVPEVDRLPLDAAAHAVAGVVEAAQRREKDLQAKLSKLRQSRAGRTDDGAAGEPGSPAVSATGSKDLLREVVRRQRRRLPRG